MRINRFFLAFLLLILVGATVGIGFYYNGQKPKATVLGSSSVAVQITGPKEIVSGKSAACDSSDVPDSGAVAFKDSQNRVQLIASHDTNRRLIGSDLNNLARDCTPVLSSGLDNNPAHFNDFEWISGTYTLDGSTIYALVHDEYHGWLYPNQCSTPSQTVVLKCWFNAVTLAVSTNSGDSYTPVTPSVQPAATVPYTYEVDHGLEGIFNPSNIIKNTQDGYYYAFLDVPTKYRLVQPGISLMRTNNLADPASWRGWDGTGFTVQFINPYLTTPSTIITHISQPIAPQLHAMNAPRVVYSTYLGQYIMVGFIRVNDETGSNPSGFYFSLSPNLISWTEPQLLMAGSKLNDVQSGSTGNYVAYPSLLDPNSTSRNFETIGQTAYLYFTQANTSENNARELVRVPVSFSAQAAQQVVVTPSPTLSPTASPPPVSIVLLTPKPTNIVETPKVSQTTQSPTALPSPSPTPISTPTPTSAPTSTPLTSNPPTFIPTYTPEPVSAPAQSTYSPVNFVEVNTTISSDFVFTNQSQPIPLIFWLFSGAVVLTFGALIYVVIMDNKRK